MAKTPVVKITFVGDSTQAQKSVKDLAASATQAEVKVEGFGKSFLKAGVALGVGVAAVGAVVGVMREGIAAANDYNKSVDQSTKTLLGQTKSQTETAAALAVARAEADKGRGTYQELAGAMAGLSTVAKTAGLSLASVTETAEILAAINPAEGIKGATFALREAASGDMTSVIERFNLSRSTINKLRAEGVPAIEAVRRAMAELGYDTKFLDTANTSNAKTIEILKGRFTELAATIAEPIFEKFIAGLEAANKAASGGNGQSFAQALAQEIRVILDGKLFDQLAVDAAKSLFLVGDAFNKLLKAISGDKLNIDGPLKAFFDNINDTQAKVTGAIKANVADPVAAGLAGTAPGSPIAPAKVQGYGAAILDNFLQGLTSGQIGDFKQFTAQFADLFKGADGKADTEAFAAAQALLAQALKEVAQEGQISETTLFRLTTTFGKSAAEVTRLTLEYGRMGAAQDRATASTDALKAAQDALVGVQRRATADLASYAAAIATATAAAAANAEAAAVAIEAQSDALSDVGAAAAAAARESHAAIDGLQATAAAHAEANQAAIAAAQSAQTAASEQRQRDSAIAQAAIRGETEAYERQTETLTEQDRKLAEHYETIIGGERRALDAANERLNGLNVAANKEDLSFLLRIKAARESGNAKEAAALQKQFDARKKARGSEMEIARAQAAVAGDEFDAKSEAIAKEEKQRDEVNAKAETEAGKRLKEVQANADAQAKADAAAIKGVQDAAKAESDRYAAQQRGIQAEIDRLQDAAKAQATKDRQALTDAGLLKTAAETRWAVEESGARVALGFANQIADANERSAKAAKETYDADVARVPAAQAAADAAEREARARKEAGFVVGGGQQNPLVDNAPPTLGGNPGGPPTAPVTPQSKGAPNLPPLYDASTSQYPPAGYYKVLDSTRHAWYVPNGYRLSDYGIQEAGPSSSAPPGGSDSLGRGATAALRDGGSAVAAGNGAPVVNLTINAPNLTDMGNPAQQRAFAAQAGAATRREWDSIMRGGGATNV